VNTPGPGTKGWPWYASQCPRPRAFAPGDAERSCPAGLRCIDAKELDSHDDVDHALSRAVELGTPWAGAQPDPQLRPGLAKPRPDGGGVVKVVGLCGPSLLRVRLGTGETPLMREALRVLREDAAREITQVYDAPRREVVDVDRAHDRLRELEGLMMWLEDHGADPDGRQVLLGATDLMWELAQGVARAAVGNLVAEHQRFAGPPGDGEQRDGGRLLAIADAAREALTTLVRMREVDHGPDEIPYPRML
jgi:hypothetical protein